MSKNILWMLCGSALLAACNSAPQKPQTRQGAAAPIVELRSGAETPPAEAPQPGAYLPGDGPGADVPANLDDIPDAVPRAEPLHRYANRQYSALGKSYVPLAAPGNFKERGIASWYGKKFHGQNTSTGEVYDMYAMTAAHPTLPVPSYARVTNIANGKQVIVRVNDRGPFLHGRIMDLSYVAAHKLGYAASGSAEVEVESIAVEEVAAAPAAVAPVLKIDSALSAPDIPVETAGVPNGKVFLQLGAFKAKEGAHSFLEKMRPELGEAGKSLTLYEKDGLTRVHFGPYPSADEARIAAKKLADKLGFKPFVSLH